MNPQDNLSGALEALVHEEYIVTFNYSRHSNVESGAVYVVALVHNITLNCKIYYNNLVWFNRLRLKDFKESTPGIQVEIKNSTNTEGLVHHIKGALLELGSGVWAEHQAEHLLNDLKYNNLIREYHKANGEENVYQGYDFMVTTGLGRVVYLDITVSPKRVLKKKEKNIRKQRDISVVSITMKSTEEEQLKNLKEALGIVRVFIR